MKVRELMKLLQGADPDWDVLSAPMVDMPHNHIPSVSKEPTEFLRIPDPARKFPVEDVMHLGDVNTAERKQYFLIGFNSERPVVHARMVTVKGSDDDDEFVN